MHLERPLVDESQRNWPEVRLGGGSQLEVADCGRITLVLYRCDLK